MSPASGNGILALPSPDANLNISVMGDTEVHPRCSESGITTVKNNIHVSGSALTRIPSHPGVRGMMLRDS